MDKRKIDKLEINTENDLVIVRQHVRSFCINMGFNLVDQTRIITAVSELTRNALNYGGGGFLNIEEIIENGITGLKIIVIDEGPGIEDLELAMTDGYSTGKGLGNGLGGSKRLLDEFDINSKVGKGTIVEGVKWLG